MTFEFPSDIDFSKLSDKELEEMLAAAREEFANKATQKRPRAEPKQKLGAIMISLDDEKET